MLSTTTCFRLLSRNPVKQVRYFSRQIPLTFTQKKFTLHLNNNKSITSVTAHFPKNALIKRKEEFNFPNHRFISSSIVPKNETKPSIRTVGAATDSELANLTPAVRTHLRSVYTTLGGNIALCGAATAIAISSQIALPPVLGVVGGLGLVLGIGFTPVQYNSTRLAMLYGFSALEGFSLAPMIAASIAVAPGALPLALIGTGGIFAGFTAMSFLAKSRSMLSMGGPLLGGLLGILAIQLAGFFFPSIGAISHSIGLYGGLALFSAYISYDTQRMIESARQGMSDVIGDSLSMFLNLANIFIRLLEIFSRRD